MKLSDKDLQRMRSLAHKQAELAASEGMAGLYRDWVAHGAFQADARPMMTIEMWTFADEVLLPMLQCESREAREIEKKLLMNILPYDMFGDDTPIRSYWPVCLRRELRPFGMKARMTTARNSTDAGAGQHFETYLQDLEEDMDLLKPSEIFFDEEGTNREMEQLDEIFGDILPVKRAGECIYLPVAEDIIHLIDMEHLYISLYECPEKVHELFDRLVADYMRMLDIMEEKGYLLPTAGDETLFQGSYCFTDELPESVKAWRTAQEADLTQTLKSCHVWGYMDAEEFSHTSPEMYKEFILESYKPLASRMGALSYGCCEALHDVWEGGLDQFDNLRKVSVSAWCDERRMGEYLQGRKTVFLRKPSPNYLGVGCTLDEEAVRAYFRETAEAARGCRLEITQRDVYMLNNSPDKARRYMEIMRDTVNQYWRP